MAVERDKSDLNNLLSSLESISPEKKADFQRRLEVLTEKRLSRLAITWYGLGAVVSIALIPVCIYKMFVFKEMPVVGGVAVVILLASAYACVKTMLQRRYRLTEQWGNLIWVCTTVIFISAIYYAPYNIGGLRTIVLSLAVLGIGSVIYIQAQIEKTKYIILEQMLALRVEMNEKSSRDAANQADESTPPSENK